MKSYILVNHSCGIDTAMKTIYTDIEKARQSAKRMNGKGKGIYYVYEITKVE